jgi:hypothetical protein
MDTKCLPLLVSRVLSLAPGYDRCKGEWDIGIDMNDLKIELEFWCFSLIVSKKMIFK